MKQDGCNTRGMCQLPSSNALQVSLLSSISLIQATEHERSTNS